MRVVMIRSNPVRPDSRVEKEAYTLKSGGHEVKILCWDRDSTHPAKEEFIFVAKNKIPIIRIGFKAGYGQGMKSLYPFLCFQVSMLRWLIANRKNFDLIHSCDFDTGFLSSRAARFLRKKFVFDIFDFIAGQGDTFKRKLLKNAQINIIDKADATIICTEERKQQIKDAHPRKLVVIHNTPFEHQMIEGKKFVLDGDKIKIAYVGILQDHRLLKEIGEYFVSHSEIEWHVGGFGKYEEYFRFLSERADNVIYYGRLQYEDTLALEAACDIMLAIYEPTIENHRFAAPNKFYEALMLGKPVIMVKKTGMSHIVAKENIGCTIEYSKDGFAEGLAHLISRRADWNEIGEKMKLIYENSYSWNIMEKRLLELYRIL